MKSKMNPVVHFEMPYVNAKRVADFYSKVFGWENKTMGSDMGNYIVVATTKTDKNGMIKKAGAINGGFFPKAKDQPDQVPSVVIAVDDIQESMKKVKTAGGKVLGDPVEIPGVGWYVSFHDTEGNRVSLLKPNR